MKIYLEDRTGTGKNIPVLFSGEHKIHLQGSILGIGKEEMEIGISLFEEDIVDKSYDQESKTLHLKYKHYKGVRIAILPMTRLVVPIDLEKIEIVEV